MAIVLACIERVELGEYTRTNGRFVL